SSSPIAPGARPSMLPMRSARRSFCSPRWLAATNTLTITSNCSITTSLKLRMHSDVLLQLDNVAVGYPPHVVLAGITLGIRRGTFTGLLGSNGSGKTTLLKTIVGIIAPLEGKLSWNPESRIGYVPQRDVLDSIYLLSS